jgi:outer membrane biosynthesis protein TonB
MSGPRLSRALGASAGAHLVVLAALLSLAHTATEHTPPAMRVSLVEGGAGLPTPSEGSTSLAAPASSTTRSAERPAVTPPVTLAPGRAVGRNERRRPSSSGSAESESPSAAAQLTPVQEDVWVLGVPGGGATAGASAQETQGAEAGTGGGAAPAAGSGVASGSAASLLEVLQRRLAWSAARCAPASAVRLFRHGVPGVPLHFCLDAAGRPSGVGLLGTTGSEQLDRAARDCVIPGALPLPPAQGCYTVEVRFPIQG